MVFLYIKYEGSWVSRSTQNFKKAAIDPYKDKIVRAGQDKESRQLSLYGFSPSWSNGTANRFKSILTNKTWAITFFLCILK